MNSPTPARCSANSAAYPACRSAMPGIMSSYRSCMIPNMPILGLPEVMILLNGGHLDAELFSSLAIVVGIAVMQGVNLIAGQRLRLTEGPGQVHGPSRVLAHNRRLHRLARG